MSRHFTRFLLLLLVLPGLRPAAFPQTTYATITGVVTDPAGSVVPNVTLVATNVETGAQTKAVSNAAGVYTLAQLKEGRYSLRATGAGFKEYAAAGITLAAREERRLDIGMMVGEAQETVEVTAQAGLIETETPRLSDTRSGEAMNALPLNTRDLRNFLVLSPQVVKGRGENDFRLSGSLRRQQDIAIDGITTNNGFTGTFNVPLTSFIESFQEVRIDMANNTAEVGAMGQVTVVSKSGSNDLHGSVFDYYSTPGLNSRNPFTQVRAGAVTHSPGFSLGGPVVIPKIYDGHNRTFFYGSVEMLRGSVTTEAGNATVPLAAWRTGDFSALLPTTVIRDPLTGRPFEGNKIPEARLNAVSRRIQERFFPLPNFGDASVLQTQNFRSVRTRPFDNSTYATARFDHHFSPRSFFFVRGTYTRGYFNGFDSPLPAIGQRFNRQDTRGLNSSFTYTLTPRLINEARYGLAFNNQGRNGPLRGQEVASSLGLQGLAPDLPDINGTLRVAFANVGLTGISQTDYRRPGFRNFTHQFQDQLSWFAGRHSVKAGVNLSRIRFSDGQAPQDLFGSVSFSNRFTGHPYADFLLGIPTTSSRGFGYLVQERKRWTYDFFVSDNFKLTPKLTLNLGLRYELHPFWVELNGRQAGFDIETGRIVVPDGALSKVSPLLPRGYVEVVEASAVGYPSQTLVRTDKNNFAPRLGVAWRPFNENTVVRAGFGVFYDVTTSARDAGRIVPFVISEPAFTNPTTNPTVIFPRIFPDSVAGPTTVNIPSPTDPNYIIPYTLQYNLTIEHQRWNTGFRISYVGTAQRQGEYLTDINQPVVDARAYVDKPRRFPRYPGIPYVINGAGHQYHGLTLEAERRLKSGLLWQFSYTLARDIGDVDNLQGIEDSYNRQREVGVNTDIPTQRVSGSAIYELPFGKGKRFFAAQGRVADALVGGWQISVVGLLTSGQFLTPTWTGPDPTGTGFTTSRTPPNVTIRPNQLRDPNLPSDQRSIDRWFDPTAFGPPTPGSFGTAARGVIIGPGSHVWHAGLYKAFSFTERLRLRLEMTATNVFNHPNFGNPGVNISNTNTVGRITSIGSPISSGLDQTAQRALRLGARLEW